MGSLKLVNKNGIDYKEYRNIYYYNEYKYKVNFSFLGKTFLYNTDTVDIWKKRIKRLSNNSLFFLKRTLGVEDTEKVIEIVLANEEIVKNYIQYFLKYKNKMNFRSEGNSVSIFGNDLSDFEELRNIPNLKITTIEAVLEPDSKVKFFNIKPKYKFRYYFTNKFISFDEQEDLRVFLYSHKDLKLSGSFSNWFSPAYSVVLNTKKAYLKSMFFIDYNDEMLTTLLSLKYSDILGKHFLLEQRKTDVC